MSRDGDQSLSKCESGVDDINLPESFNSVGTFAIQHSSPTAATTNTINVNSASSAAKPLELTVAARHYQQRHPPHDSSNSAAFSFATIVITNTASSTTSQSRQLIHGKQDLEDFMDKQKSWKKNKNQKERSQVCSPNMDKHQMRYIILKCTSSTCSAVANSQLKCVWFIKIHLCISTSCSGVYQSGIHLGAASSPKNCKISLGMHCFVKEREAAGEKPSNVMNKLVLKFELQQADRKQLLPRVQKRIRNHRKTVLNDNDFVEEMAALAKKHQYTDNIGENVAFSYGYTARPHGKPLLDNGSEGDPLIVGFATKAAIRRLRFATQYMTHLDTIFKLNTRGFPVIAIGISDMWRQFHLVAMFLVSDIQQPRWEVAKRSTLEMCFTVTDDQAEIDYVMMDTDAAQRSGFESIAIQYLELDKQPKPRMCFFHVVKKTHYSLYPSKKANRVQTYYRIHYAHDLPEMQSRMKEAHATTIAVVECALRSDFAMLYPPVGTVVSV